MFLKDELQKIKERERAALIELAKLETRIKRSPEDSALLREQKKYSKIAADAKAELKFKKRSAKPKVVGSEKRWSPVLSGSFESGKRR
ncbi:hypothetical protein Herbaro_05960 [Herbaspirillum sp. WKF16]|uniref:hypothetical protein n=1 Tax=Herbaspirillum sp. WKF16 TaxID=3028312 RepID=UPI0023A98699|nr:hypothetical protein [Herbaspirillum sp. WKF16]WDZ97332.1 hypothetical protein Herbaro_05960 [Herbaspirillum sp. WKF16]